jgi:hypothetical protein
MEVDANAGQCPPEFVNIALGKFAEQSSLSRWSTELGAREAVSGKIPKSFSIHTDIEDSPWWKVDLAGLYPIDHVVVYNRKDAYASRARSLKVEVSRDGKEWMTVHAGITYSGGSETSSLRLPLGGRVLARFVRVSLTERQYLHLAQVAVFVQWGHNVIVELWKRHQFDLQRLFSADASGDWPFTYRIDGNIHGELKGFRLIRCGRFGNNITQLLHAISLAILLDVQYIELFDFSGIELKTPVTIGKINIISPRCPRPMDGYFLTGHFFYSNDFGKKIAESRNINDSQINSTLKECFSPLLMDNKCSGDTKHSDELTIHIRAGDIFRNVPPPHPGYIQPPLSFYVTIIEKMIASSRIKRVRIVYEDRGNPCVDALEAFLVRESIAYRMQSGTLLDDLAALINSRHLVFGVGTFGLAVALLSDHIDTVHVFEQHSYNSRSSVDQIVVVSPREKYIPRGEWQATREQLDLMLSYPKESLVFETIK